MRKTKEKGITLIALIITIIIMLILAGVTIVIIMNGGLFEQANEAALETRGAFVDEQAQLWRVEAEHFMSDAERNQTRAERIEELYDNNYINKEQRDALLAGEVIQIGSRDNIHFNVSGGGNIPVNPPAKEPDGPPTNVQLSNSNRSNRNSVDK